MADPLDRADLLASYAWECMRDTACEIKNGVLTVFSADGANMLWNIYSLEGFEKFTKALLANLEFVTLIPTIKSVFAKCKESFEMQRDLYYATLVFCAYAWVIKYDENGNPVGLRMPPLSKREGGGIDWSAFCYCIAAVFDTAQFLKKYAVLEFAFYSRTMGPIGAYTHLNRVPVIQSFFDDRPKEFFVVLASIIDLYRGSLRSWQLKEIPFEERDPFWTMEKWEAILKIVSSIGKIVGISCYRSFRGQMWLAIVGLVGSNASLCKFVIEDHRKRMRRNEFP